MDLFFKSAKLQRLCNSAEALNRAYGRDNAARIRRRLAVLAAAPTLGAVPTVKPERRHALKGDRSGCWAVDALHPFRIVFSPNGVGDSGSKVDAALRATSIVIIEIVDYH